MSKPDQDVVFALLEPYHPLLVESVMDAWNKWSLMKAVVQTPLLKRTRANNVWNIASNNFRDKVYLDPDVHPDENNQTCHFLIKNTIRLRIKKADERGLSRNYPTQSVLEFHDPETEDMFGVPFKVELVYVLDRTESRINKVEVVSRDKSSVFWKYPIFDSDTSKIIPLPVQAPGDDTGKKRNSKFQVKKQDGGEEQEGKA